jgi:hypothetical protein
VSDNAPNGSGGGGSSSGRRSRKRQGGRKQGSPATEFWGGAVKPLQPEPVAAAEDPTALLRSLGAMPLAAQAMADHYVAAVITRASSLATALAAAAGLLESSDG